MTIPRSVGGNLLPVTSAASRGAIGHEREWLRRTVLCKQCPNRFLGGRERQVSNMELGQFSSLTRIAQGPEAHRAGRIGGTSGMARPHACRFGTLAAQDRTGVTNPYTPYTTLGRAAGLLQRVTPAKTPDCRPSGECPATLCASAKTTSGSSRARLHTAFLAAPGTSTACRLRVSRTTCPSWGATRLSRRGSRWMPSMNSLQAPSGAAATWP